MNNWYYLFIIILAILIFSMFLMYPSIKNSHQHPKGDIYENFLKKMGIPAAQIRIIENGNVKYSKNFSGKDIKIWDKTFDINVDDNSLFRVASVSKTVTAIAILYLIDKGHLKLEDKMITFMISGKIVDPSQIIDKRVGDIMILDLLRHSGGWDTSIGLDLSVPYAKSIFPEMVLGGMLAPFDPQYDAIKIAGPSGKLANQIDLIRFMMHFPLNFSPGTREKYSNFGYNILGRIIEVVSGMSYERFVIENLFSDFDHPVFIGDELINRKHPGEVYYYDGPTDPLDFSIHPSILYRTPSAYGSFNLRAMDSHGGWVMNTSDLAKFGANILNNKFFGQMIFDQILKRPSYLSDDNKPFYSLGMKVSNLRDGDILLSHNGALTFGTFAYIGLILKKKIVIAVETNHLNPDIGGMLDSFQKIIVTNFSS